MTTELVVFMELIFYSNPILMAKNREVAPDEENLAENIRTMFDIMYAHDGIGLAAPQAGWNVRLFVLNVDQPSEEEGRTTGDGAARQHDKEMVFINPRILSSSGAETGAEGCLSFPGLYVNIRRKREILVEYQDLEFKTNQLRCEDLLARAVQHETDHLDNILLVHRMSHTEKVKNRNLLDNLKERYADSIDNGR
jgi:peptide deformylase